MRKMNRYLLLAGAVAVFRAAYVAFVVIDNSLARFPILGTPIVRPAIAKASDYAGYRGHGLDV
jgi:hypothetical protein